MTRATRVFLVTLGLVAAGAAFGGLAGAVAVVVGLGVTDGLSVDPYMLTLVGAIGGVLGAVIAPALAWLLLRRVPLGRMFLTASGGTVLGGVLGWVVPLSGDQVESALLGAFTGCFLAAASLRTTSLRPARSD